MKRYGVSVIVDGIFTGFAVFFTSFIIFGTFSGFAVTWVCSLLVGLLATALAIFVLGKRRNKKLLSAEDLPKKENLMFYLALNYSDDTFIKLFDSFGKTVFKTPNGLYIKEADSYLCPVFDFDGVTKNRVAEIYKLLNGKHAFIFAPEFSPEVRALANVFGGKITLMDGDDVYELFKKAEMLPPPQKEAKKQTKPQAFKTLMRTVFTRKRAPRYFLFGIAFMLFSFLVPFKLYYIIFGSVMMAFSLASIFVSPAPQAKKFWEA